MEKMSPGKQFRYALKEEQPLQLMGAINAYCARMAERVGYRAIYLSGAGVANACYGLPDLAVTSLDNVCEEVRRITAVTTIPLIVDMDTGWGSALNVSRSVSQLIKAGAAGAHIEDQVFLKRCGHRPNKALVSVAEMVDRITAAIAGKTDPDFYLIARTDALAQEGVNGMLERARAYVAAGADAIFAEAITDLSQYQTLCENLNVPVLANITEFGKTPLFTVDELKKVGVGIVLYPLSAFRAMNQAALTVYQVVRENGTQASVQNTMQDRETLYDYLDYYSYENHQ